MGYLLIKLQHGKAWVATVEDELYERGHDPQEYLRTVDFQACGDEDELRERNKYLEADNARLLVQAKQRADDLSEAIKLTQQVQAEREELITVNARMNAKLTRIYGAINEQERTPNQNAGNQLSCGNRASPTTTSDPAFMRNLRPCQE